jgi:hypothetical protein
VPCTCIEWPAAWVQSQGARVVAARANAHPHGPPLLQVQAALMEVSRSPWKVVKHLFNAEVMGALKVCVSSTLS